VGGLCGEGAFLDRVITACFVIDLVDHLSDSDVAVLAQIMPLVFRIVVVGVLNCGNELVDLALARMSRSAQ
jgi:hypothetical protein